MSSGAACFSGDMLAIVDSNAPSISSCMAAIVGLVGMKGDTGRGPKGRPFLGDSDPDRCEGVVDRYVGCGDGDLRLRPSRSFSRVDLVLREEREAGRVAGSGGSSVK